MQRVVIGIRTINDIAQVIVTQIVHDVVTTEAEEGTDDMRLLIEDHDAGETLDASAAHEVHEQRLNAVVLVMSEGDGGWMVLVGGIVEQLLPPSVSQLTGCHFEREMLFLHIAKGVKFLDLERYVEEPAELLAETLVTIGLSIAQMEVTV